MEIRYFCFLLYLLFFTLPIIFITVSYLTFLIVTRLRLLIYLLKLNLCSVKLFDS